MWEGTAGLENTAFPLPSGFSSLSTVAVPTCPPEGAVPPSALRAEQYFSTVSEPQKLPEDLLTGCWTPPPEFLILLVWVGPKRLRYYGVPRYVLMLLVPQITL